MEHRGGADLKAAKLRTRTDGGTGAPSGADPAEGARDAVGGPQTLLTGVHARSLDGKGRLVIPSQFRPAFADGVAITPWEGPCVALIPTAEFLELDQKLLEQQRAALGDPRARFALMARTTHAFPDAQGRLFIPEAARDAADLPTDVMVVGTVRRLELWDPDNCLDVVTDGLPALESYIYTEAL